MRKRNLKSFHLEHWHIIAGLLMLFDILALNLSYFLALWFRFDCVYSSIPGQYILWCLNFAPWYTAISVAIFCALRLYNSIWRFASFNELMRIGLGTVVTALLHIVGMGVFFGRMPFSYYLVGICLQFAMVLGVRFSYRFLLLVRTNRKHSESRQRVMLIGAGSAGQMILKSVHEQPKCNMIVCCIIDDNPNKWNRHIQGVPVVGGRDCILDAAEKYRVDKIFVAIPGAKEDQRRDILNICKETGCQIKSLPGINQLVRGQVSFNDMQEINVEDLLGREPIHVDMNEIYDYINGKVILVTGGGGSIGSELCRQIADHNPKQLIIFEVYENNAYDIEQELRTKYPRMDLQVRIGSVRDSRCLESIFSQYRPEIVYHAAAHKHVPLMEASPCEAIKNNVLGTYKTAYAAMYYGCRRFVLISTDKAVNPTNIMGASKRLCEMVIQSFDRAVKAGKAELLPRLFTHHATGDDMPALPENPVTEFVAVRFGNVLGSNGSVIPLFKKQIQAGGPITVTHRDIIRYFMTIPEAVSLVMQAGTYAGGGQIFVLDMGAPVRIDDLARNLVKLSGLTPDVDIKITYTGLRPGEKLYEEKLMAEEGLEKTPNQLIHIGRPVAFDIEVFLAQLKKLMDAAYENDDAIRDAVAEMVPSYRPELGGSGKKDGTYESLRKEAAIH